MRTVDAELVSTMRRNDIRFWPDSYCTVAWWKRVLYLHARRVVFIDSESFIKRNTKSWLVLALILLSFHRFHPSDIIITTTIIKSSSYLISVHLTRNCLPNASKKGDKRSMAIDTVIVDEQQDVQTLQRLLMKLWRIKTQYWIISCYCLDFVTLIQ